MNARYIEHSNQCYDWGSFGWALESESADVLKYKYFIFLNSSVRGPFMPAYLKVCVPFLNDLRVGSRPAARLSAHARVYTVTPQLSVHNWVKHGLTSSCDGLPRGSGMTSMCRRRRPECMRHRTTHRVVHRPA